MPITISERTSVVPSGTESIGVSLQRRWTLPDHSPSIFSIICFHCPELWEHGYSLGGPCNGCLVGADWNYTFLLLHFIRTNYLQLFIFLKDKWQQSRYDSPLTILMEKLEALPDGQIHPSCWWKLGSHHCNLRCFNFFGGFHFQVAFQGFPSRGPTRVLGLSEPDHPLFRHIDRSNEADHVSCSHFIAHRIPRQRPNLFSNFLNPLSISRSFVFTADIKHHGSVFSHPAKQN